MDDAMHIPTNGTTLFLWPPGDTTGNREDGRLVNMTETIQDVTCLLELGGSQF